MDKTLYDLIGVPSHASPDEIESACIALGRRLEEERSTNIDAERKFAELEMAYEVLGNPDKRREYDSTISIVSGGSERVGSSKHSWPYWLRITQHPITLAVTRTLRRYPRAFAIGVLALLIGAGTLGPRIYARWLIYRMGLPYSVNAFSAVVSHGNNWLVETFLKAGMDPDSRLSHLGFLEWDGTGLGYAAYTNDVNMARLFIRWGAKPNQVGIITNADTKLSPLQVAFDLTRDGTNTEAQRETNRSQLVPVVGLLLENGAIPNWRGRNWYSQSQDVMTRERSLELTGDELLYHLIQSASLKWKAGIQQLDHYCNIDGYGTVKCTFTNTGDKSAESCVRMVLKHKASKYSRAHSAKICTGRVGPGDVWHFSQRVTFYDHKEIEISPTTVCLIPLRADNCIFDTEILIEQK